MHEFVFSHHQNGERVGYIKVTGSPSMQEAVSLLSDKYKGVFKLASIFLTLQYKDPPENPEIEEIDWELMEWNVPKMMYEYFFPDPTFKPERR